MNLTPCMNLSFIDIKLKIIYLFLNSPRRERGNKGNLLLSYPLLFILFIGLTPFHAATQTQTQAQLFTPFPYNNTLTAESINDIIQDNLGYIWIATSEGLNRFDGQKIWKFTQDYQNQISGNDIQSLAKDQSGRIWMGTVEGYLQCYDPSANSFKVFKVPTGKNAPVTTIWDVEVGNKGEVWLALERGIACFYPETETFRTWRPSLTKSELNNKNYDVVYSLLPGIDSSNTIWIGSRKGLLKFDYEKESFDKVKVNIKNPKSAEGVFEMIYNDEGGIVFTASRQTVFIYHPKKGHWQQFQKENPISISLRCIFQKSKNEYLVGDIREGLFILNTTTGTIIPYSDAKNNQDKIIKGGVEALFLDNKNTFWVGTEYGLVWRVPTMQYFQHHYLPLSYKDQYCKAFVEIDEDNILVATFTGQLLNYYLPTAHWSEYSKDNYPVPIHYIYSMLLDKKGYCWIATREGLFQVDYKNKKVIIPEFEGKEKLLKFNTQRLLEDQSGKIWSNTYPQSLLCIDSEKALVTQYSFKDNDCPSLIGTAEITNDPDGRIWYGGEPRLNCFDPEQQKCIASITHQPNDKNGLSNPWITSMVIQEDRVIWLGYKYGGLDRFDPTTQEENRFKYFTVKDGLPSNKVFRLILDDQQNLWMATGNGIARMNTQNFTINTFNSQDGLKENNLHKFWRTAFEKGSSGKIYIGGQSFFTIVDPSVFYKQGNEPQLVFNGLRVFDKWKFFDKNLNQKSEIELSHEENFFTFEFANLAIRNKQQTFRYRLEGFDREWRYCTDGKADYTDVGGGNYNFIVQVPYQKDGWANGGLNIELKVIPPIWQERWFQFVMVLLGMLILFLAYQARVGQIKKAEALKTAFNRRLANVEVKALRAQMNPHFLFNSLNSIKNFIIKKEPRVASLYLTKFARLMRLILSNSKDSSVTLENELKALSLYIELEAMRFPEAFDYTIDVDDDVPSSSFLLPPLILQPYVENAIKHGLMHKEGKGKLDINIARHNGTLIFKIKDNGIGREQSQAFQSTLPMQRKSMGMQITADRLEMLDYKNGQKPKVSIIDLKNSAGEAAGTQVEITIPFPKKDKK